MNKTNIIRRLSLLLVAAGLIGRFVIRHWLDELPLHYYICNILIYAGLAGTYFCNRRKYSRLTMIFYIAVMVLLGIWLVWRAYCLVHGDC